MDVHPPQNEAIGCAPWPDKYTFNGWVARNDMLLFTLLEHKLGKHIYGVPSPSPVWEEPRTNPPSS